MCLCLCMRACYCWMFFGALYTSQHIYQPVFDRYLGNAVEVSPIWMFVWRSRGSEAIYFGGILEAVIPRNPIL